MLIAHARFHAAEKDRHVLIKKMQKMVQYNSENNAKRKKTKHKDGPLLFRKAMQNMAPYYSEKQCKIWLHVIQKSNVIRKSKAKDVPMLFRKTMQNNDYLESNAKICSQKDGLVLFRKTKKR